MILCALRRGKEGLGKSVLVFSSAGVGRELSEQERDETGVACEWSVWKGFVVELQWWAFLK